MIPVVMSLWAAQAAVAPPPPVRMGRLEPQPISAVSWTCETSSTDHEAMKLFGTFPSISVESQKNGGAFRLQSTMQSSGNARFSGAFPTAMTGSALGMDHYSILIPNKESQVAAFVLTFELFEQSNSGFVTIAQFDPKSGAPSAYASGLCTTQVTK